MPIDAKRSRLVFRKLAQELTKLERKAAPENVHKFRTNSRRVEALLMELVREPGRNDEKVIKLLARLRKKAGRVRDLDVQISCLRNLKIPQANGHKAQLLEALLEERARREKKLAKAFDHETAVEIRKRLKRAASHIKIPPSTEPISVTLNRLAELGRDHQPISEKILHRYRIIGKRARYIAELAVSDPGTTRLVADLKKMQDVIGDWHDWLKLTQKAEKLLGSSQDSALVAMLRNVTQAKFHQSLDAVSQMRESLATTDAVTAAPGARVRKAPGKILIQNAAA